MPNLATSAQLSATELLRQFDTSRDGLTAGAVRERQRQPGKNLFTAKKEEPALSLFLAQFRNWLMVALLAAAAVSFFLGERLEAAVIAGLILMSGILGFVQEYHARRTLAKLTKYIAHQSRVKRDGIWVSVDSQTLVTGDWVEVRLGDIVPADIVLLSTDDLTTNESILTGESAPVGKNATPSTTDQPTDLANVVLMGTNVAAGRGEGIIVAVGTDTRFGQTAALLSRPAPETAFQKQTRNFSKFLFKIILVMTIFVFVVNAWLDKGLLPSFLFAVALAVGIAPELLPAITTITLSRGALKIAKKKVIVKRLMSVEDLGNIDTLCTDKTGTLTKGEFSLVEYQNLDGKKDQDLVIKAMLCLSGDWVGGNILTTNPVDQAILTYGQSQQLSSEVIKFKVLDENEFDFERRRVSVLVVKDGQKSLIVKGSIESMLQVCNLKDHDRQTIQDQTTTWENQGYRVIGIGTKPMTKDDSHATDENGSHFLGFLLFSDPIKPDATQSLAALRELGVKVKILSGDSKLVTAQVAAQVGFAGVDNILTGEELDHLPTEQWEKQVRATQLFARLTPEQKYRIVASLNKEGHVVGFLGDGINDAPALQAADVGIAVNGGAAVAKEAADIILLEKDLQVLAEGIQTGRQTFGNIMKYILNTISANYGNMLTMSLSSLFLPFIPLLPAQILLNNFISDIPLFAVTTDRVDVEYVRQPKHWDIKAIGRFMLYFGLISSFFDLLTILPMAFVWHVPTDIFRTVWFVESSLSEMLITFAIRTRLPFYRSMPGRELMILSAISMLGVVVLPLTWFGTSLFEFAALPVYLWGWIAAVLLSYFATTEAAKHWFYHHYEL